MKLPSSPVTQEMVTLFVAYLGAHRLSESTIHSYLAALRHSRLMSNPACLEPSLYSQHLKVLLRGIKRVNASHNARIRLPITASIMHRIKGGLQAGKPPLHEYSRVLLWAACCVGYFGFLRTAEFLTPDDVPFSDTTHLSLADISLDQSSRPWKFLLRIKASKTDQFCLGTTVVLGGTKLNLDLCPVAALLDYLNYRRGDPGPLFCLADGQALHRRIFVQHIQAILTAAGLPGSLFNGHSFRIGAAFTASAAGVPETLIKQLGRWKSFAYQQYIRPSTEDLTQVSHQVAQQGTSQPGPGESNSLP